MSSSSPETAPIPSPRTSFPTYHTRLLSSIALASRAASSLPQDVDFHRSLDRKFAREVDRVSERVLALVGELIRFVDIKEAEAEGSTGIDAGKAKGKGRTSNLRLLNREDVEDNFEDVVDVTDGLLERADIALDQLMGRSKAPMVVVKAPESRVKKPKLRDPVISSTGKLDPSILNARIPKPQLSFAHPPNNFPPASWRPHLQSKPHALVPLGWSAQTPEERELLERVKDTVGPYAYEILRAQPPSNALVTSVPQVPKSFEDTPFEWVGTPDRLAQMLEKLKAAKEIAVDLEHHDYRSYRGIVCLMQLSTREADWVVDTLALREELEVLNEVFADSNIVKVFHGATMDINWLQRDFNLYIVNLFDTYYASKALNFPAFSLAFLLDLYCEFKADKRFQLADWRIRPLPQEMMDYARSDTHFLLYVYDQVRNDLLKRVEGGPDLVEKVFDLSKDTALQVWEPERYDPAGNGPGGWQNLTRKWNKHFMGSKLAVFKAVYAWRDRVAREEDEGLRYVLTNPQMFALAENCPRDMKGTVKCLVGATVLAMSRVEELAELIRATLDLEKERERERQEKAVEAEMKKMEIDVNASGKTDPSNRFAMLQSAEDVEMGIAVEEAPVRLPSIDIWGTADRKNVASSLTLFGATLPTTEVEPAPALVSRSSTFFGNTLSPSLQKDTDFQAARQKIHSGLFLFPSVNVAPPQANPEPEPVLAGATAEIPFVPRSARQTQEVVDDRNTIVVVGQKQNKKRKRALQIDEIVQATASATTAPGSDELPEDQFPDASDGNGGFDYSALPNLLEVDPATLEKKPKKSKKNKGPKQTIQNTDFKKPRKPRTDPKSGSRSMTFK